MNTMDTAADIKRIPVARLLGVGEDFLKRRSFYIPDYQRGYRWTSQQVEELLQDLLVFAINEKNSDAYYCLQPIVVRNDVANKRLEVIDGQQRLTTLKIVLHYLEQCVGPMKWNLLGVTAYPIVYATREHSNKFIEELKPDSERMSENDPIDYYYMRAAYFTVKDWFEAAGDFTGKGAPSICQRLHVALDASWDLIKDLLVRESTGENPTAQVLWYEVGEDESSIKLFNRLNTGKLELTDAELIKGLFLLRTNFAGNAEDRGNEQFRKALKWERMENVLHGDGFWSFLTPRRLDVPNRIDLLLKLVYRDALNSKGLDANSVEDRIAKKHAVFNYYNDLFNVELQRRQKVIEEEWGKIESTFSILSDWYSEPMIYNLIGYICQTGIAALPDVYFKYCQLKKDRKTRVDFIAYLKDLIGKALEDVSVTYTKNGDERNYAIELAYDRRAEVFRILLLLNVVHLNRRASEADLKSGEIETCKFPFAVLGESWDIEHVDSQTANDLKEPEVRREWLDTALSDLSDMITPEQRAQIRKLQESKESDAEDRLIRFLRCDVAQEADQDDDAKNNISNLVLLDASTNRSYKNSLFVRKRKTIIQRRENGQYVPETTSYVFFKLFEKTAQSRWRWTPEDMQVYANYMVEQLKDYLPEAKEEN